MNKLKEKVVFNCMGFNAMKIFDDKNAEFRKGHLLYFQKKNNTNYHLKYKLKNKEELTIYP